MSDVPERKYLIPGLERGLKLLMAFSQQEQKEMSFAELHRLVDMPKATAYRIVQSLEFLGFLQRNNRTNTFSLGINVLRLGFEYIASLDVVQVGQSVIEQLRDQTGFSSHLAIRDEHSVIYVGRVSGAGTQINEVRIGTRLPVHRTSLGRMLLTDMSRADFEQLYPDTLLPATPTSSAAVERETLWKMVQEDRVRGYVVGESFYHYGISSIVFPVFNRQNRVEAVISILVPSEQIPDQDKERLIDDVRQAAAKISGLLGASSKT